MALLHWSPIGMLHSLSVQINSYLRVSPDSSPKVSEIGGLLCTGSGLLLSLMAFDIGSSSPTKDLAEEASTIGDLLSTGGPSPMASDLGLSSPSKALSLEEVSAIGGLVDTEDVLASLVASAIGSSSPPKVLVRAMGSLRHWWIVEYWRFVASSDSLQNRFVVSKHLAIGQGFGGGGLRFAEVQ